MPLPTSTTWDIADFDQTTMGSLLLLGPGLVTATPSIYPYFSYDAATLLLATESADGTRATLDINAGIPSQFTVEFEARFPALPMNLGDLAQRSVGITLANGAGRGISIYFAVTGLAVSRVDDFGSVTALPDTSDAVSRIQAGLCTVRIAVDGNLGRAYVFLASDGGTLELRYIVPVEATPSSLPDRFQLFVQGTAASASRVELRTLRVASTLIISNHPPIADAGPDRVAAVGQSVRLDGRASYDVEGAAISYAWTAIDAPFGSQYAAEGSSGRTVDNGDSDGLTDLLSFTPGRLPDWVVAGDILVLAMQRHVVATFDNALGQITITTNTLSDSWSGVPFRIIRQSLLVGATTETPYLLADVQGPYRFQLVVNDGNSDSEPGEVLANIVGARAPMGVEPDVRPLWRALGDEWTYIEGRQVFTEAWTGVAQILSAKLLEVWQHHYNYSLRDAQRTFQRKWIAYRSLVTETSPDTAVISPRYGLLRSTHEFEAGDPAVPGLVLSVEYFSGATATETLTASITLGSSTLSGIVASLNAVLLPLGIAAYPFALRVEDAPYRYDGAGGGAVALSTTFTFPAATLPSWAAPGDTLVVRGARYTLLTVNNPGGALTTTTALPALTSAPFRLYRMCRLGLRSTTKLFRVLSSSSAALPLGMATDRYSSLSGNTGALVTDRTYYAGDGVDLSAHGVADGDLFLIAGGQSFSVARTNTDPLDPLPNQRILSYSNLPLDAGTSWSIPSVVKSADIDYEREGAYPGDLVKTEVYDTTTGAVVELSSRVLAQKGKQLAVSLGTLFGALTDTTRYAVRLLGLKRCKGIPISADVVSIPRLQDVIPVAVVPTIWNENEHYILEPMYRDTNEGPLPFLQFRDSVFIASGDEPPDILWAEVTIFSNDPNVEDLFGRMAGFLRDDASQLPPDFNYVAGVAGLTYAQRQGPKPFTMQVGAQILLGQPFAEVAGTIEEILNNFSPIQGRVLVRDWDGNTPSKSEVVRSYYYSKDPLDPLGTSGLAVNPGTLVPWATGDSIGQFQPIGAGVNIVDLYNTPDWYIPYVRCGILTEIEKFHYFLVRFNLDLVSLSNLALLFQFITRVKPTYTHPLLVGLRMHDDTVDVVDELEMTLRMNLFESTDYSGKAFMYDDYRGDGTIWSKFGNEPAPATFYDGLIDCPTDTIELCLTTYIAADTVIPLDAGFFMDLPILNMDEADVVDPITLASLGPWVPYPPGTFFNPAYDMVLPAGRYRVCIFTKSGSVVLP